jgi:hypothetical protein
MRAYLIATLFVSGLVVPAFAQEQFVDENGVTHWCNKSCSSPYFRKLRATAIPAPPNPLPAYDLDKAEALIKLGDFSGARLLLGRSADRGDARALLLLAKTYDPKYLPEKRYGFPSDAKKAEELYSLATKALESQAHGFRAEAPIEKQSTNIKEPVKVSLEGENIPESEKVFGLLRTTKATDAPEPIPPEIVTVEPLLSGLLYRKRADGEIELLDDSGVSLGTLKHETRP